MSNPHNLKVGQELYCVWRYRKVCMMVAITKIGRKWAEIGNDRVCLDSMIIDGGPSYGTSGHAYLSKEEHDNEMALADAWQRFSKGVSYSLPEGMTLPKLAKAAELLGIDIGINTTTPALNQVNSEDLQR